MLLSAILKLTVENKQFVVAEMSHASNSGLFSKHMSLLSDDFCEGLKKN